jgi:hypothetical protein
VVHVVTVTVTVTVTVIFGAGEGGGVDQPRVFSRLDEGLRFVDDVRQRDMGRSRRGLGRLWGVL